MSNASATPARPASLTPACWRWAGSGSRCATAPATDPPAAPPTVSVARKRRMVCAPAISAYGCSCVIAPRARPCTLLMGLLASAHRSCLLFVQSFFLSNFSLFVVQQEFQGINQPLVLAVPRSPALSADQRAGRVNVLPIHKADQRLTAYFSAHALYPPSTPPCAGRSLEQSAGRAPAESRSVNVCASQLLIEKLFMLLEWKDPYQRGQTAPAFNRRLIQMRRFKFVYGCALRLGGGKADAF